MRTGGERFLGTVKAHRRALETMGRLAAEHTNKTAGEVDEDASGSSRRNVHVVKRESPGAQLPPPRLRSRPRHRVNGHDVVVERAEQVPPDVVVTGLNTPHIDLVPASPATHGGDAVPGPNVKLIQYGPARLEGRTSPRDRAASLKAGSGSLTDSWLDTPAGSPMVRFDDLTASLTANDVGAALLVGSPRGVIDAWLRLLSERVRVVKTARTQSRRRLSRRVSVRALVSGGAALLFFVAVVAAVTA